MSTLFSIGQMNQLGDALESAGFTPVDVTSLRSFSRLSDIKKFLMGELELVHKKHVIDCDADPFLPEGWSVGSHKKGGKLEWNPANVRLHLSKSQENGGFIVGNKLRKELESQPVLNANMLDYLLAHPDLIPEEWKGKYIFFWGTIYRYRDGNLVVRYLYWDGGLWDWNYLWLVSGWRGGVFAACAQVSSK